MLTLQNTSATTTKLAHQKISPRIRRPTTPLPPAHRLPSAIPQQVIHFVVATLLQHPRAIQLGNDLQRSPIVTGELQLGRLVRALEHVDVEVAAHGNGSDAQGGTRGHETEGRDEHRRARRHTAHLVLG